MRVTIITACYNRAGTIQNAIKSVMSQTYPDIEYIVMDGASSDGSTSVIEECLKSFMIQDSGFKFQDSSDKIQDSGSKIQVKFISEPDHGMYEAINSDSAVP